MQDEILEKVMDEYSECISKLGSTMSVEQEEDLYNLKRDHNKELDRKYRKGAHDHGGDLLEMTPLEAMQEALAENLDQYVYIKKAIKALEKK